MIRKCFPVVAAVLFMAMAALCLAQDTEGPTWLVIPARYTIVQLGVDMADMRDVELVSYFGDAATADPPMHVWDGDAGSWVRTGIGEYSSGAIPAADPAAIILVGGDKDLPGAIVRGSSWCESVGRIPTLNLATVINSLNEKLRFTPNEWRWLARRYGLKLKDQNAERRRYGKYGKPGERRRSPMPRPEPEEETLVPVPVDSDSVAAPSEEPIAAPVEDVEKGAPAPAVVEDVAEEEAPPEEKPEIPEVAPEDK